MVQKEKREKMDAKVKAAITSCVLLAMASNSYSQVTVTSELPDAYIPGQNVTVTLTMNVDESDPPVAIGVEDTFPAGWTYVIGSADPDHINLNSDVVAAHRLGWLFWSGGLPVQDTVITYVVTPPAEEDGTQTFSGIATVGDVDYDIVGDTQTSPTTKKLVFTAQPVGQYQAEVKSISAAGAFYAHNIFLSHQISEQ